MHVRVLCGVVYVSISVQKYITDKHMHSIPLNVTLPDHRTASHDSALSMDQFGRRFVLDVLVAAAAVVAAGVGVNLVFVRDTSVSLDAAM